MLLASVLLILYARDHDSIDLNFLGALRQLRGCQAKGSPLYKAADKLISTAEDVIAAYNAPQSTLSKSTQGAEASSKDEYVPSSSGN